MGSAPPAEGQKIKVKKGAFQVSRQGERTGQRCVDAETVEEEVVVEWAKGQEERAEESCMEASGEKGEAGHQQGVERPASLHLPNQPHPR